MFAENQKVEAKNLEPFTTYFYQFAVCNSTNTSPLGRTKTTPKPDATVNKPVKLAVYSCSNYRTRFHAPSQIMLPIEVLLLTSSQLLATSMPMATLFERIQ